MEVINEMVTVSIKGVVQQISKQQLEEFVKQGKRLKVAENGVIHIQELLQEKI